MFTPEELDISLDPTGRPYDVYISASETDYAHLTDLVIPNGKLRVMDGNAIQVHPGSSEAQDVDFHTEDLEASIVWGTYDTWDGRSALAVVISVPDTIVDRWEPFEYAYGTDGGTGGFTSQTVIDLSAGHDVMDDYFIPESDLVFADTVSIFDLDNIPGVETLVFSNGVGDGAFPMSRGVDTDGRLVALAIVDLTHPWRLMFPQGTPPPDVTTHEDQLAECLIGQRDVQVWGNWGYSCLTTS